LSGIIERAFWFLRHGETDWNAQNLAQGNVDIPLNAQGIAQARQAAAALCARGIEAIAASPLGRARETAEIVAATLGVAVEIVPDLREVAFGVEEGQPMSAWFTDWVAGQATPEGGESFAALRARAARAVNRLLAAERHWLVVAHGGLFRAVRAEMGLSAQVRTANGVPIFCAPPRENMRQWRLLSPEEAASAHG
jgi:probable phosphoglycerate mutase